MKSVLQIIFFLVFFVNLANASDNPLWVSRYNGTSNGIDEISSMTVDNSGNVYVTGRSQGISSNYDYITLKYNTNGDTVWIKRYNGPGNSIDEATDIAVDNQGNVYVTGRSVDVSLNTDYATIKYNSNGDVVWLKRYNGPGNQDDNAYSLAIDEAYNVYVTGRSVGTTSGADFATIKYNSNGDQQWVARYNGLGNFTDHATSICFYGGSVIVTGWSCNTFNSSTSADYVTIKYNNLNGDSVWVKRYNGPGNNYDQPNIIKSDNANNIYVTGFSRNTSDPSTADFLTIKYNFITGDSLWVKRYNGPGNNLDEANSLAIDVLGNVYVVGVSVASLTGYDFTTVKYTASGAEQWTARYNFAPPNGYDEATDIVIDNEGNVYVTGFSAVITGTGDFATIRYNSAGVQQWVDRYNGPGNNSDAGLCITRDSAGFIYVGGNSNNAALNVDYTIIKYDKITGIENISYVIPERYSLSQNYPNPFNPATNFEFMIANSGFASLKIFDIKGNEVAHLVNQNLTAGKYKITFDGSNLSSGIYYYQLNVNDFSETKKMLLIK